MLKNWVVFLSIGAITALKQPVKINISNSRAENPMATNLLIKGETSGWSVVVPRAKPMSRDEFHEFCIANRDLRIERTATGEVIVMPPAFSDTGNRNFNLAMQLGIWAEKDGTGLGFDSSAGFTLPNGATRSPDASWIRTEKWEALTEEEKASFAPICPNFVIELRSKSDTLKSLKEKMVEYIDNGVSLGWLIDRKNRSVYIYRPNQEPQILKNQEVLSGEPELKGFQLPMTKIW